MPQHSRRRELIRIRPSTPALHPPRKSLLPIIYVQQSFTRQPPRLSTAATSLVSGRWVASNTIILQPSRRIKLRINRLNRHRITTRRPRRKIKVQNPPDIVLAATQLTEDHPPAELEIVADVLPVALAVCGRGAADEVVDGGDDGDFGGLGLGVDEGLTAGLEGGLAEGAAGEGVDAVAVDGEVGGQDAVGGGVELGAAGVGEDVGWGSLLVKEV